MPHKVSSKFGLNYLGNSNTKEVHQTARETTNCQIGEFLAHGHGVGFTPDSLAQAHADGYDNCAYCIGNSKR